MFSEVYRESLEGAIRRDGPHAVLLDVVRALTRVGRELDPAVHRQALRLACRLQVVRYEIQNTTPALVGGLNRHVVVEPEAERGAA